MYLQNFTDVLKSFTIVPINRTKVQTNGKKYQAINIVTKTFLIYIIFITPLK
jgi:hypothetical protein